MRDTCLNCGKEIEEKPFDIRYCSEDCKIEYKASVLQFPEYQKGRYSILVCKELDVPITSPEHVLEKLENEAIKFGILIGTELGRCTRYLVISKRYTLKDKYNKQEGLIKNKEPKYTSLLFDYFEAEGFVIFHSEIHKVETIIKHLNNTHNSQILIPRNIDLKVLLDKLDESKINCILGEGRIVNFELDSGTIGNYHFKSIVRKDLNGMIAQKNAYFSSLKFHVEGIENHYRIELCSNGSFFLNKYDSSLFEVLKIYLNLIKEKILKIKQERR